MEKRRADDRERNWAGWMRAANAGDEIAYRRLLEALAPFLGQVVRRGFTRWGLGNCDVAPQKSITPINTTMAMSSTSPGSRIFALFAVDCFSSASLVLGIAMPKMLYRRRCWPSI